MPLVSYSSDSDDETESSEAVAPGADPISRKRTLPALPDSFPSGQGPNDDPALHQGRKRTRPYVDGDHDTHIYISLEIPKRLSEQIKSLVTSLQASLPDVHLHTYLSTSTELHVSLSHAFPLRQSQIPQFRTDLTRALQLHGAKSRGATPLRISLGGKIRVYRNGRRYGGDGHGGRTFLALQVGAGAKEIDGIVQAVIHPLLKTLHRPLYHSDPEYHASFAWCLTEEGVEVDARVDRGGSDVMTYPTADPFAEKLLRRMDVEFELGILGAQPPLGWVIDKLVVKIGKDVLKVPL